jgi:hypothetical protein
LLNRDPLESYSAYLDGHCLSDAEVIALRTWISASEKNATEFIEFAILHAAVTDRLRLGRLLDDLASHRSGGGITPSLVAEAIREIETNSPRVVIPLPPVEPAPQRQPLWQILAPIAAVAAVLMVAAWGFWQTAEEVALPTERPLAVAPPKPEPPRVAARLSTSFDAQWADDATVGAGREFLEGSQLNLVSGVIKLEMLGGAAVVIEGPSLFQLPDPDGLRLERGKAAVRIAEGGGSFVVDTPSMQVIDLGTEFGVESSDGGDDQVMVFDGSVALASAAEAASEPTSAIAAKLHLGAGFQVNIESDEQLRAGGVQPEVLTNPRHFLRPDEIDVRLRALAGSAADKKLAAHYERQRLKGLLAYQGFDAASGGAEYAIGLNGSGLHALAKMEFVADADAMRGGIDVQGGPVFMWLDTSPTGPFARAGMVADSGRVGRSGAELWLTWRAQRIQSDADDFGSVGVSLMFGERSDHDEPVFFGRGFGEDETFVVQTAWGGAPPSDGGERITSAVDFATDEAGVQSRVVDNQEHTWVVRVEFRDGPDAVSVWMDADLETLDPSQPQAALEAFDVEFDRIRMAVNRGDAVWRYSEFAAGLSRQALEELAHVAEFQVDQ